MSESVRLLIHAEDGSGEGLWGRRTAAPGIFELDNFPISAVNYTSGDLVMAADDGEGRLYVTGVAERRFRGTCLRCEANDDGGPGATTRYRAIAKHLEAAGVRVEGLVPGWIGAAVPVGMSEHAFAELLANAPYAVREMTDEDADAPALSSQLPQGCAVTDSWASRLTCPTT
jgi:hypothetical protein